MPPTKPQTRARVIKVHEAEFKNKAPISPHEVYTDSPRLGLKASRVAGLSLPLETEFSTERLRLSEFEINAAGPSTPEAMTDLVYNRIKSLTKKVIDTTTAKATKAAGKPGKGSRSQEIQKAFDPFMRRVLTKGEIDATTTDPALSAKIADVFKKAGRLD